MASSSTTGSIKDKLEALGLTIPDAPKPLAAYVGYVRHGDLVYVSGQLPMKDGQLQQTGLLGADVTIDQGRDAAQLCAINILAQVKAACDGDIEKISQCIRLGGFVASTSDFYDHPQVINGASEFIGEVLGARGAHCRAAVGVAALPLNASVEIEATFAISR